MHSSGFNLKRSCWRKEGRGGKWPRVPMWDIPGDGASTLVGAQPASPPPTLRGSTCHLRLVAEAPSVWSPSGQQRAQPAQEGQVKIARKGSSPLPPGGHH